MSQKIYQILVIADSEEQLDAYRNLFRAGLPKQARVWFIWKQEEAFKIVKKIQFNFAIIEEVPSESMNPDLFNMLKQHDTKVMLVTSAASSPVPLSEKDIYFNMQCNPNVFCKIVSLALE